MIAHTYLHTPVHDHARSASGKIVLKHLFSRRGLSLVTAGLVSLCIAEFATRFTQPELNPQNHIRFLPGSTDRPTLGPPHSTFRQIKNTGDFNVTVRFNAIGLRDGRNVGKAEPDDFMLVGDSFTFGWGVKENDRISEQLEGLIKHRVYNVSIPVDFDGYEQLLEYAKKQGSRARRVIIAVSMESDLQFYGTDKKSDRVVKEVRPRGSWLIPFKSFLTEHSAFYALLTTLVHRTSMLKAIAAKMGILIPNLEGIRKFEYSQAIIESSAQRLKRLAGDYEATIIVIPSRTLWHGDFKKTENRRHTAFMARLRALGLTVLDLRPVFEKTKKPLSLHFKNDPHWRPAGHKTAAEALASFLRQRYNDI